MLISVIIPVYKTEQYLDKCIQSVLSQTYKNLEIILIDDGSPDNSGQICDNYANSYPQIKVIHQENQGLSAARNAGLRIAAGDLIAFVDSDDYIDPTMFATLLTLLQKHNLDIISCISTRTKHHCPKQEFEIVTGSEAMSRCLRGFSIEVWTKLYKKELFNDISFPHGRKFEDVATTYKLYHKATRVGFTNYPLYHYYLNSNSITQTAFNSKSRYDYVLSTLERLEFVTNLKDNKNIPVCKAELLTACLSCLTTIYIESPTIENKTILTKIRTLLEKYENDKQSVRLLKSKYKLLLKSPTMHHLYAKLSYYFKRLKGKS